MKPLSNNNRVWAGKACGAAIGFIGGGPFGLVVGAIAGHVFDRVIEKSRLGPPGRLSAEHTTALFRVMGHLAKADGRVNEQEIEAANALMRQLELTDDRRQMAIRQFSEGKSSGYSLSQDLTLWERTLPVAQQERVVRSLIEFARADKPVCRAERKVIKAVTEALGWSPWQYYWQLYRQSDDSLWTADGSLWTADGSNKKANGSHRKAGARGKASKSVPFKSSKQRAADAALAAAYRTLGVSEQAPDADIKRAFRKLMSECHPDKLQAQGVSEEALQRAKAKAQDIQMAYALIRKQRRGA